MLLKALIIDHNHQCNEDLRLLILDYFPEIGCTFITENQHDATSIFQKENPQLVFIDCELTEQLSRVLPGNSSHCQTAVIFTSAIKEMAIQAVKQQAVDFLLKPYQRADVQTAIQRAREKIDHFHQQIAQKPHSANKIILNHRGKQLVKKFSEILYCQADSNYTIFHFNNGEKIITSKTLKEYEQLFTGHFVRVHSKYLVNLHNINSKSEVTNFVELKNGLAIPISRRKRADILLILSKLQSN